MQKLVENVLTENVAPRPARRRPAGPVCRGDPGASDAHHPGVVLHPEPAPKSASVRRQCFLGQMLCTVRITPGQLNKQSAYGERAHKDNLKTVVSSFQPSSSSLRSSQGK